VDDLLARFERTLSSTDSKRNLPFQVQVPTGTTRLDIRLVFSPWVVDDIKNMLTLTVFDPSGFRGAGHRHGDDHRVTLNTQHATPGYRAGPIQAGEWTIVVDTHMIMPGAPLNLQLEVGAMDAEIPSSVEPAGFHSPSEDHGPSLSEGAVSRTRSPRGRGWYRGDLHAHTLHSDAKWDIPGLVAWAREEQLDFMTLSDHNTVSGLAQLDAMRDERLLTMGGMELTTFWGHALALGLRDWVDWRVREGERTIEQIVAEVNSKDGTFIIAHPLHVGDPYCTGCQWRYGSMMPGRGIPISVPGQL
jgi:hypothetical protein